MLPLGQNSIYCIWISWLAADVPCFIVVPGNIQSLQTPPTQSYLLQTAAVTGLALVFTACIRLALFQFHFSISAVFPLQLHHLVNTRTDTAQTCPHSPPLPPVNHSDTPIFAFDLVQKCLEHL